MMRTAFWTTALLAVFAHWIPHYPPQIDLAQHAGQMRFLYEWTQPDFQYRDILELNLFTPYLPAYLLGALLSAVMSPVLAVKLLWSIGAFGTVYASVRIRRRLGGSAEWDWLLLPGLFGVTFVWGLLSFQFAMPFGLLAVEHWLIYLDRPTASRGLLLSVALIALFFCHALVTAWALAACGAMTVVAAGFSARALRFLLARGAPLLGPLPVVIIWLSVTSKRDQARGDTEWRSFAERLEAILPDLMGGPSDQLAVAVGAILFLSPFLAGQRFSRDPVHSVPLLLTALLVVGGPFFLFGSAMTNVRFVSLLPPSLVIAMAARPFVPSGLARLRRLVPLLASSWVLFILSRMMLFSAEQAGLKSLMSAMEPGLHVLSVVRSPRSEALGSDAAYLHFPVWYQAEVGGLVEFNFAAYYPMLIRFKPEYSTHTVERFVARPSTEVISLELRRFDRMLVRASAADTLDLGGIGAILVHSVGDWRLYATQKTKETGVP